MSDKNFSGWTDKQKAAYDILTDDKQKNRYHNMVNGKIAQVKNDKALKQSMSEEQLMILKKQQQEKRALNKNIKITKQQAISKEEPVEQQYRKVMDSDKKFHYEAI